MKILATGCDIRFAELQQKLANHELVRFTTPAELGSQKAGAELVIDLDFDTRPQAFPDIFKAGLPVLVSAALVSLAQCRNQWPADARVYGLCCLPTFVNRPLWETTVLKPADREPLEVLATKLQVGIKTVGDRVGMASPRVVCMIVNEAYYTVQEGTATKADIDTAMKLGTNYPFGPFEWSQKIGLENVYALLSRVYDDTRDERYKICPLLKQEWLDAGE